MRAQQQRRTRLFIYGSLMTGQRYHDHMAGALHVRSAWTQPSYELVDLGEYPALMNEGSVSVRGEVWEVGPTLLKELDAFEEHPDIYRRTSIELTDGDRVEAYLFVKSRLPEHPRVPSGDWCQVTGIRN